MGEPVYLMALFPLGCTLLAVAISEACGRSVAMRIPALVVLAMLLVLAAFGIRETYANRFHQEDRLERDPWPAITAYLLEQRSPADGVVVVPGWPSPGGWYLRRTAPFYQVWRPTPYFRRTSPYARLTVGDPLDLAGTISDSHADIWLLHFRPGHYPHEKVFFQRLEAGRARHDHGTWGRVRISSLQERTSDFDRFSPDVPAGP